ncbi:putative 4-amino-4-deoxy-L-arabinose transferase [Rhodovulum sp. PH10]|uniref:glycosyltransferase family 39 protein n=1 Tax=Rhodovulum sp. PH10 TaxID=1187851 RepID=UPI00027C2EA8|nr:glycosyltransferase family 39 protein [Rhodovulum sp. PH10]EJW10409.1 putative 4-amino-4-deoxy-L-arabinose transferase [Rhodovulum sp. PH10]
MTKPSRLSALVEFARKEPFDVLAVVLLVHLGVWTLMPALLNANLQLDLAEDLALGKEWQLVYWKHPPLPWWIADAAYRLTGDVQVVYLLGPLAAVVAMWAVWRLGREIVGPFGALVAVLTLEGLHFFNFSVVKFAHDQCQLPFWALTALFFWRALKRERLLDWALAGVTLALCFWSKYAAFALAATLGLFLLVDRDARKAWRTPGPYLMALAFVVVIAPNVWALVQFDFMPFRYVDERAKEAAHWWQVALYPLQWTGGQLFFLVPTLLLLWILYPLRGWLRLSEQPERTDERTSPRPTPFDRRYLTWLAIGPFVFTTLVAMLLGRLPVAMWGYPLWTMLPLAVVAWRGPVADERRLKRFAGAVIAVLVIMPAAYVLVEEVEPYLRDRPKATQFPGKRLAEIVTRDFIEKTGQPLTYVTGTEFAANNVAVYSPFRPHVIVHGDPKLSPWIDMDDVRRRGVLIVWEPQGDKLVDEWMKTFPGATVRGRLMLPRQAHGKVAPVHLQYAIVPPAGAPMIIIPVPPDAAGDAAPPAKP